MANASRWLDAFGCCTLMTNPTTRTTAITMTILAFIISLLQLLGCEELATDAADCIRFMNPRAASHGSTHRRVISASTASNGIRMGWKDGSQKGRVTGGFK